MVHAIFVTGVGMGTNVICRVIQTVSCQVVHLAVINVMEIVKTAREINGDHPVAKIAPRIVTTDLT